MVTMVNSLGNDATQSVKLSNGIDSERKAVCKQEGVDTFTNNTANQVIKKSASKWGIGAAIAGFFVAIGAEASTLIALLVGCVTGACAAGARLLFGTSKKDAQ